MNLIRFLCTSFLLSTFLSTSLFSWSLFTRLEGGHSFGYITSPDYGAGIGASGRLSDIFSARLEGAWRGNDILYDGNGNHMFTNSVYIQGQFFYFPNDFWEVSVSPSYSFFQNLSYPEAILEGKYTAEKFHAGAYAGYGKKSYLYMPGSLNVTIDNIMAGVFYIYEVNKKIDLNISGDFGLGSYNTSGAFNDYSFSAGVTWYIQKSLSIGADILAGFDSSNYTMAGLKMNLDYDILENLSLGVGGSFKGYSTQVAGTASAGGATGPGGPKSGSGGWRPKTSIRSAQPSFNDVYISAGLTYTLDFSDNR